ncbi:MAG: hypothetical protein AB7F86_05650 [Bdellovibrionales bacterium]
MNSFRAIVVFGFTLSTSAFGYSDPAGLVNLVKNTCPSTVLEFDGSYGKEYDLLTPRFAFDDSRMVSVMESADTRQIKIHIKKTDGSKSDRLLPLFEYKRILLIGDSIWFLQDNKLVEYNINQNQITGEYPSYTRPFEVKLSTRARGFAYSNGYIYIAHGEFGVVLFDVKAKKPYTVINAGLMNDSLAGAVEIKGDSLYVLQGAYSPIGFNGLSIYDLKSGWTKTIGYPPSMGVVDPYTSTMKANDDYLFVNNSGWIHAFDLKALATAPKTLAPVWISVVENIATDGGNFQKFLMVNGDLVINQRDVVACSSISYTPVGKRRPVTEFRTIYKPY